MREKLLPLARAAVPKPAYLWLRSAIKLRYLPNVIAPRTFNEKVLAKMLFDRSPALVIAADKLRAREYVAQRVGEAYLPRLYAVWSAPEQVRLETAWRAVALKANHGSGFVELVPDVRAADLARLRAAVARWLAFDYGRVHGEWCYRGISPRAFAEELLGDGDADALVDYKFFCFAGEPRFIKVIKGMKGATRSFYADLAFEDLHVRDGQRPLEAAEQRMPPRFDEMLALARRLADGFEMIRVDLFNIEGRIVVGELTNYPQAAAARLRPDGMDLMLGRHWNRATMRYLPFAPRA